MRRISLTAAVLLGSSAFGTAAFADPYAPVNPASDTIHVGLEIVDECTLTATDLSFGSHGIILNQITGDATVTIECTHDTPYHVGLSDGQSGDTADRFMTVGGSGDQVHYQLYSDSGYGNIWGSDQGVDTVDGSGTDDTIDLPVYGKIDAHQNVAAGNYTDTITATVWYAGSYTTPGP